MLCCAYRVLRTVCRQMCGGLYTGMAVGTTMGLVGCTVEVRDLELKEPGGFVGVIIPGDEENETVWVWSGGSEEYAGVRRDPRADEVLAGHGVAAWGRGVRGPNPWPAATKATIDVSGSRGHARRIRLTTTTTMGSDLLAVEVEDQQGGGVHLREINGSPVRNDRSVSRAEIWRSRTKGARDSVEVEMGGCGPLAISVTEVRMVTTRPTDWRWSAPDLFVDNRQSLRVLLRSDTVIWSMPPGIAVDPVFVNTSFPKIVFRFDSARVTLKEERKKLPEIAQAILAQFATDSLVTMRIEGHTDSVGSEMYNLGLGKRRAKSVLRELMDLEAGLPVERFVTLSHGDSLPAVPHRDVGADQLNRRVEFVAVRDTTRACSRRQAG